MTTTSTVRPRADASDRGAGRDVVVVGGGNAGICAAIAAREAGRDVLLLERASRTFRGGNSRHTRDIRYAHEQADRCCSGSYPRTEFLADLEAVSDGRSRTELATLLVDASTDLLAWMSDHGINWQESLSGTLHLSRTNAFFLGGGRALLNSYYATAERLGVEVAYETSMVDLELDGRACRSIGLVGADSRRSRVAPRALVLAAGGIEADGAWLREHWADAAERFIVRGTKENDGTVLRLLIDAGVAPVGDGRHFHAVPVDARSPRFDGGIVTRVDAVPFGIVVNEQGQRFYDEGETSWPKRYAIWGRLIAEQPGQRAWVIFDEPARAHFIPPVYPPLKAGTIADLVAMLPIPAAATLATIEAFNRAVPRNGAFDPGTLDGLATTALTPAKSNWARPIEAPPFYAYPLSPGITFSYAGVRADERARAVTLDDQPLDNVFVAGELMAGNILSVGYLAGVGLTIGTVFGRIAGQEAAHVAARRAD